MLVELSKKIIFIENGASLIACDGKPNNNVVHSKNLDDG